MDSPSLRRVIYNWEHRWSRGVVDRAGSRRFRDRPGSILPPFVRAHSPALAHALRRDFGPGDFSQGIGAPGEWNHPLLVETRKRVADAAKEHGKFAGTVGSHDNLNELISMGYNFVSLGADVVGLKNYCEKLVSSFPSFSKNPDQKKSYFEN